jgi:hypothetical protein
MNKRLFSVVLTIILTAATAAGQNTTVSKELKADVNRAAGMSYAMPLPRQPKDTPVPGGKKPFYVNHYACSSGYYLDQPENYEWPYSVFAHADSVGKLTKLGRDVMQRLDLLRQEARGRTGELTEKGAKQSRALMRQLVERLPDAFVPKGYYSARSVVDNRCIMTMQEAMVQLSAMRQPLQQELRTSVRELRFMDPEDKLLTDRRTDSLTQIRFDRFTALNTNDARLMTSLFSDQNYVISNIDATELSRQLFRLAGSIQHTELAGKVTLFDIFTPEEIHCHWRNQNAWNYINYGGCTLNGGTQPYLQRAVLRNMIHMGDSVLKRYAPMMHARYTHQNVLMSLASLMELDNCGLQTDNLDSLELAGWANYRIAPLGGSIVMIHYRNGHDDPDVLVKVLLNGHEARLPIDTDCAPYYHWQDVKRYYLRKLYRYENMRFNGQENSKK